MAHRARLHRLDRHLAPRPVAAAPTAPIVTRIPHATPLSNPPSPLPASEEDEHGDVRVELGLCRAVLEAANRSYGYSAEDAATMSEILLYGQVRPLCRHLGPLRLSV